MFQRKTPLEKEWADMEKEQLHFLKKRSAKKESFLNRQLSEKVPKKLQNTLELAFAKAFGLIFEKGTDVINKTFDKKKMEEGYKINEFIDSVKQNRKSLRVFSKKAKASGTKNLLISGAAGIGMGIVGAGLPDIPLFTTMVLKSVYEIAINYGYRYDTEQEKYFILMIIQGAVSWGEQIGVIDEKINKFMMSGCLPKRYDLEEEIRNTARSLSKELLYMKFLQGIPLVGTVGGVYDVVYMKQITEYANIKYRRRFLVDKKSVFSECRKNKKI